MLLVKKPTKIIMYRDVRKERRVPSWAPLSTKDKIKNKITGLFLGYSERHTQSFDEFDRESEEYYKEILEKDPKNILALNEMGVTLVRSRRYDEALDYYNRAFELYPMDSDVLVNKGNLLARLGRYDEARQNYDRAIELEPDNNNALFNKGCLLIVLDKFKEALEYFNKARKEGSYDPDLENMRNRALQSLGMY
ncbi:MAG: tetratricopeptide repeat protein [Thaumarchaeota archaeon]|nr:tetratricopeptide repeat protein [Nitrososphaerota archaeon]